MPEMNDDEQKALIKEAISEWLDKQFAAFGKFALVSLCSLGLAALLYFILINSGWKK